jgi:AbrB family looped-hinge helix DNA binding protein
MSVTTVTVSRRYKVVIPRAIRDSLGLKPGQKFDLTLREGRIELIPMRIAKDMRGFLSGISTAVPRDDDRA